MPSTKKPDDDMVNEKGEGPIGLLPNGKLSIILSEHDLSDEQGEDDADETP